MKSSSFSPGLALLLFAGGWAIGTAATVFGPALFKPTAAEALVTAQTAVATPAAAPSPQAAEAAVKAHAKAVTDQAAQLAADPDASQRVAAEYAFCAKLSADDLELIAVQPAAPLDNVSSNAPTLTTIALDRLFALDPAAALAFVRSSKAPQDILFQGAAVRAWTYHDPAAALQWALQQPPDSYVSYRGLEACAKVAPGVVAKAVANAPTPEAKAKLNDLLLHAWVPDDLAAAMNYVRSLPANLRSDATSEVAYTGAAVDPKACFAFLTESGKGGPNPIYDVAYFARQVAVDDPEMALSFGESIQKPLQKQLFDGQVIDSWSQSDPQGAWAYATTQLTGQDQAFGVGIMAASMAHDSPLAAAAKIEQLPDGDTKTRAADAMIGIWAKADPTEAATWVTKQRDGKSKSTETAQLVRTWTLYQPEGAAKWVQALPPGAARDFAVTAYASGVVAKDPASALTFAAGIADPKMKLETLTRVYKRALTVNLAAAQQWLAGANLDPALVQTLQPAATAPH